MITDIAFSPDGKYIASSSWDGNAKIWDVETKKMVYNINFGWETYSVQFSSDSKYFLVGGNVVDEISALKVIEWKKDLLVYEYSYICWVSIEVSKDMEKILTTHGWDILLLKAHWDPNNIPIENKDDDIKIIPNPVADKIECVFNADNSGVFVLKINDLKGNEFLTEEKYLTKGDNRLILNTGNIPAGVYFLSVIGGSGSIAKKFVLVR